MVDSEFVSQSGAFPSSIFIQPWLWIFGIVVAFIAIIATLLWKLYRLKTAKGNLQSAFDEQAELLTYALESGKQAKATASEAIRTKSLLLVRINHEIRTPLNGIQGMTSLMTETHLTSEQEECVGTIRECGDNLLRVVNDILLKDILDFSKVEPGNVAIEKQDFSLENTLEEVLDVFGSKAANAGIDIIYNVCPNVPRHITSDKIRLSQILTNLLENALRYTHKGEILINVQLRDTGEGNAVELGFEVHDTGIGMSRDQVNVLLADMSNLNSMLKKELGGVGLMICKKLVELMGGTIHIESTAGKGTSVFFSVRAASAIPSHPVNYGLDHLAGKKILVVEDNLLHASFIKEQLQQWGLCPEVVPSGKQGLAFLSKSQDTSLVLIDHQVSDMQGIELGSVLRKLYPSLPLMLLSPKDGMQAPELFNAIVFKPLKRHLLSQSILNCFRQMSGPMPEKNILSRKFSENFSGKHPLRILIAEDNPTNQKLAMRILRKLGYTPDIASHGKEAFEIVSRAAYDVILMDVQMPEMDGLEASRMIRMLLGARPVIIAMTANTLQGDREACLQAGMDDYISKPIDIEDLVHMLEKWSLHIRKAESPVSVGHKRLR